MKRKRILVIGGAGYVGSHFSRYAHNAGYEVTVWDNLSTGHRASLRDVQFVKADLLDGESFRKHLSENHYHTIFHFAASCLVPESISDPAKYYRNNVVATFTMLEAMRATNHHRVVFSSTCAVYGMPDRLPLTEDHPQNPITPYGRTKLAIEWMLEDYRIAYGFRWAALRYFNAAGCEPDESLGEDHRPETHLIPNVIRYALQLVPELIIFGNDYPTPDGTCIRDYVHVMDLAEAHTQAMEKLDEIPRIRLNLGTGSGYSNLQVLRAVERVTGLRLDPAIGPRRPGDPAELVADARAAEQLLRSPEQRSITSMPGLIPTAASTPAGSGHSASHHPALGISVPWKNPGRSLVIVAYLSLSVLNLASSLYLSAFRIICPTFAPSHNTAMTHASYDLLGVIFLSVRHAATIDCEHSAQVLALAPNLVIRPRQYNNRVAARQRVVCALDLDGHPAFQEHVNLCAYHVAMARLLGDLREHGKLRISRQQDRTLARTRLMAPMTLGSRLLCRGENFGDENLPAAARLKRRVTLGSLQCE